MLDRKAESLVVGNRPDCDMTIKVGAKSDGTLTALEMTYYTSGGNRRGDAPESPVIDIYQIPNLKIQGSDVYVNTGGARPTRAPMDQALCIRSTSIPAWLVQSGQ